MAQLFGKYGLQYIRSLAGGFRKCDGVSGPGKNLAQAGHNLWLFTPWHNDSRS